MIAFDCPLCGKRMKVKDELAGRRGRCGSCKAVIDVPRAAAPAVAPGLSRAPTRPGGDAGGDEDGLELQTLLPTASGGPAGGPETLLPPGAAEAGPAVSPELYDFLAPPEGPGEIGRLGPYRVLKVLGAGGMGVVFLAEDAQLKRQVALKAMLPALSSAPGNRDRFLREARAAASVSHDNVITIYQVGEDRGTVYLAMQLLQGETLEDRIRRRKRQPVPEVLRIGREIAAGLAAAHEKGLVHRDIKPGNVWLEGEQGRVKILDFGLARAARGESQLTQSGAIVGTPAYMAPEQARGGEVDARCDLFSLGCVLYRMCAGELPFKGSDTLSVLTALALETPPPVDEVNPDVPPALADLVTQLLEKEAGRRPKSARAVIEVLAAIEGGKTGERRPRRAGERTVRLVGERVERGLRTMTAPRPVEEDDTRRMETSARRGRSRIDDERRPRRRRRSSALGWVVVGVGVLGLTAVVVAVLLLHKKTPAPNAQSPGTGGPGAPGVLGPFNPGGGTAPGPVGAPGSEVRRFTGHSGAVFGVAFSPDGRQAVSGGSDRTVRLWDVGSGRELHRFEGHTGRVVSVAYSPDGRHAASAAEDGTVRLWDVQQRQAGQVLRGHQRAVQCVVFSSDGSRVVSGSLDDTIRVWDVRNGQETDRLTSSHRGIDSVGITPDGRVIFSGGRGSGVNWWSTETGKAYHSTGYRGWVLCLTVSRDGRYLLVGTGSGDDSLFLQDVKPGNIVRKMQGGVVGFFCATFTPDGRRVVAGGFDNTFRVWTVSSGRELHRFTGHTGPVRSVSVSGDGRLVLSASEDGTVRLWEMPQ